MAGLMAGHMQVSSYVLEKLVFGRPIQFSNIDDQVCNLFSTGANRLVGLIDWLGCREMCSSSAFGVLAG